MGGGSPPPRRPYPARQPRVEDRERDAGQIPSRPPLLRERKPLRVRGEDARGARVRERPLARGRIHRLEAERLPVRAPPCARRGEAPPVQPPSPHSRGRRGGP